LRPSNIDHIKWILRTDVAIVRNIGKPNHQAFDLDDEWNHQALNFVDQNRWWNSMVSLNIPTFLHRSYKKTPSLCLVLFLFVGGLRTMGNKPVESLPGIHCW
jgi:hypothetical protein